MYPSITGVTPRDDYTLLLVFDNGELRVLDMEPILDFGPFQRIRDLEKFKRVQVAFDTIEWDCGVDLDPEYIYNTCAREGQAGFES